MKINDYPVGKWIGDSKKALQWFIDMIGQSEWERRRRNVIEYFQSLEKIDLTEADVQTPNIDRLFRPIAVYEDWMAWYMYLIESAVIRPGVGDALQFSRILPFFAAVGRNIDALQSMSGIDDRLKVMLNARQNKPDSTLFELAVAALYRRNGWIVHFLKERMSLKTPDFEVTRAGKRLWVECKRLAKVTQYAENERAAWQKRFRHLTNAMRIMRLSAHAEVVFKIPVEDTPEEILGQLFQYYVQVGWLRTGSWFVTDMIDFRVNVINIDKINIRLDAVSAKKGSPQMVELLAGEYDMHGSYTQLIGESAMCKLGPDDGLHVLNVFYDKIYAAYSAKWDCTAETSIDKKGRDVKKTLSQAVDQIPFEGEGIIHIGYETVNGPLVEKRRQQKTKETIDAFDFRDKQIEAVYCHAIQPLAKIEEFECAETTLYFEKDPGSIFTENLLLDPPGTEKRNTTHWDEDLSGKTN